MLNAGQQVDIFSQSTGLIFIDRKCRRVNMALMDMA